MTSETFDVKAGGSERDAEVDGVGEPSSDGAEEASPDGEAEAWPDGDATEEDGAGSAVTPELVPHAVTVADTQARARTPRWRSFRISDIRQGKGIPPPLVTKS
ncbi:hypothetical protein AB0O34_20390 [Sphaerisporangium sp. NPDC088356]|uniref:hypothetical protein n=1 Tax=Sphaerisporangium sp. NPDC088356 TaxID=3154871 RepID=UPI00342F91F8